MGTIVIGDVQGCLLTLERLLAVSGFDEAKDRLWFTGDLVNRGPDSLGVLRRVRSLGDSAVVVLGNHDLHLLARAAGVVSAKDSDSLDAVLAAPDRDELLDWLRRRPLVHHESPHLLVHAGLHPRWTVETAVSLGDELREALSSPLAAPLLRAQALKSDAPLMNPPGRTGVLAVALRVLTRMRTCTVRGEMCHGFSGPPEKAPFPCRPWFEIPSRRGPDVTVVFGHWSALGFRRGPGFVSLDTGCVWGGPLSAIRLEDGALFQVESAELPTGRVEEQAKLKS
ncbi:MAG: symmetrical bis(5'-nucleosyl)-tetraphosphatase [Thermoanaerobaculia bacterium]|nr:Bis(5'-nucleosyl)-tetraphosphatase, symmetrical [Thermoanaerobaculia bacterium]MCK6681365.1 symmetrical bis(5'-nucleosyl)-tetraphosphatase [Thermoanaerobaculia bacterium]